jgi:hypothetical protein
MKANGPKKQSKARTDYFWQNKIFEQICCIDGFPQPYAPMIFLKKLFGYLTTVLELTMVLITAGNT